jgi:hypothetical protein
MSVIARRDFIRLTGAAALTSMMGLGTRAFSSTGAARRADELDLSKWIQPVQPSSFFESKDWCIWCGSMIQGDDGLYHLFYSRWPRELGHTAWVTHSEVARAVAENPLGPYRHVEVVLPARGAKFWDGSSTHNPTIVRAGESYYLYYMGNFGDGVRQRPLNWTHRNNQRIGVAMARSLDGPWERKSHPLIDVSPEPDAPDALMVSNPTVCARPGGGWLMIYKAVAKQAPLPFGGPVVHLVATSDSPAGPFTKRLNPVFTRAGEHFAAEDPFVWHDGESYRALVKDNNGIFTRRGYSVAMFESQDGFDWSLSKHPFVTTPEVTLTDGRRLKLSALERPQLWLNKGEAAVLFCAGAYDAERDHSFNVAIPLKRPA